MTEARDLMAARRAAWHEASQALVGLLKGETIRRTWSGEIWEAIDAFASTLEDASLVEDADLSALEDGDPVPGKCQDKACPGPHLLPVRAENCPHCSGAVRENGVRLTGGGLAHTKCYEEWAIKTADELTRAGERRPLLPERRKKR